MSEINTHNPSDESGDIDIESVFLSIAARLKSEMDRDAQARYQSADLVAESVASENETGHENTRFTKLIAVAGLTFAVGWIAGKKQ